jgi:hypothetical protein
MPAITRRASISARAPGLHALVIQSLLLASLAGVLVPLLVVLDVQCLVGVKKPVIAAS